MPCSKVVRSLGKLLFWTVRSRKNIVMCCGACIFLIWSPFIHAHYIARVALYSERRSVDPGGRGRSWGVPPFWFRAARQAAIILHRVKLKSNMLSTLMYTLHVSGTELGRTYAYALSHFGHVSCVVPRSLVVSSRSNYSSLCLVVLRLSGRSRRRRPPLSRA